MLRTLSIALATFAVGVYCLCLVSPARGQCRTTSVRSFRQGYVAYQPTRKVVVQKVAVVKRVVAFDVPQYYYGVADGYTQSLIADAAAYRALKLQIQAQQYQTIPQAQAAYAPVPQADCPDCQQQGGGIANGNPVQIVPQNQNGYTQGGHAQATGNWKQQLSVVMQSSCLSCHNAQKADGGLDLTAWQNATFDVRSDCERSVRKGAMPKGNHPALSAAQKQLFRLWVQSR